MVEGLQVWRHETTSTNDLPASWQQLRIGWEVTLDGRLSMEWWTQLEAYWVQWHWRKSSKWWTVELIKKWWNISWDLWDHWNEALHNLQTACNHILDSRINDQICTLFKNRLQALPSNAFALFKGPLDALLQCSKTYKEQLAALVEAAMWWKQQHEFGAYLL